MVASIPYHSLRFNKQNKVKISFKLEVMSPQEATRQRVVDLLRAATAIKTIMEITGAKKTMIYDIRSKMKAESDLEKVTKRQS